MKKTLAKALSLLLTLSFIVSLLPSPVSTAQAADTVYSPAPGPIIINFGSAELDGNNPSTSTVTPSFDVNGYEFVSTSMNRASYESNGIWMRGGSGSTVNMRIKVPAGKYRVYFFGYLKDTSGGLMSVSIDGQTAGVYDFAATDANTYTELEDTVSVRGKETYDLVLKSTSSATANFFPGGIMLIPTNELDVVFGSAELDGNNPSTSTVTPSFDVNGYEFVSTSMNRASYESNGIWMRGGSGSTVNMRIKVPAGKYRVYFFGYLKDTSGGLMSVSIDGQTAGVYDFATTDANTYTELEDTVTLTGKETYDLVLKSTSSATANFFPGGIMLVPVEAVRMQFYNKAWAGMSPLAEGSMLTLKDYNCEIDADKTVMSTKATAKYLGHNSLGCLDFRPKGGEYLVMRTFVPDAGRYAVEFTAGYRFASGGTLDISVGGKSAGEFNFAGGTTYPHTETLPNIVTLDAGWNEIVFKGTGTSNANMYTYLAKMSLTPVPTETLKVSAEVDGILKYVGDYSDIHVSVTSNDVALADDEVELSYAWDTTGIISSSDNKTFTAQAAGTAKLTITAANKSTGSTAETSLDFTIAERPTVAEAVQIPLADPAMANNYVFSEGYNLTFGQHGCTYLFDETNTTGKTSLVRHASYGLYLSSLGGEILALRTYIPVSGTYRVKGYYGYRSPGAGAVTVKFIGSNGSDQIAGDLSSDTTDKAHVSTDSVLLPNVVSLEAGYQTIYLVNAAEAGKKTYNYPRSLELIPLIDEDWSLSASVGGIFKYVGDTAALSMTAETESGTDVPLDNAAFTYSFAPEGVASIDESTKTLTALSAGSTVLTIKAEHPDYSAAAETTIDLTVAERPTVAEVVNIKLFEPKWGVWPDYKSPFAEGYNLNIPEYGCEYLVDESSFTGNGVTHTANRLNARIYVGGTIALRTYVPVAGKYSVVMTSGQRATAGGVMSVSVAGQEAGSFSFQSDDTTAHSSELKNVVDLSAGYQTIVFTCTQANNDSQANLYPASLQLVPYVEKDWAPYAKLSPSIKYAGDTVDLLAGAKWSDDSEVNPDLLELSYDISPADVLTLENGKITANTAGTATITVTAKNLRNGDTKTAALDVDVAERPSEQSAITIDFNKAEYGFAYNSSPLDGTAVPNIDDHGYEVDKASTTCTRYSYNSPDYGITARPWEGQIMAFRFYVPVTGLYRFDFVSGYRHNSGADIDIYLDNTFVGDYSFNPTPKTEAKGETVHMNTIMLEAGFHTVKFHCTYYNTGGNCYFKGINLVPQETLPELDRVECDADKLSLFPGEKTNFTAKAILNTDDAFFFQNVEGAEDTLTLEVEDESILTLSEDGEITALKTGTTSIIATAVVRGVTKTSSLVIEVTDAVLESVSASLSNTYLFPDDTAQITLSAKMSDGQTLDLSYPTITLVPVNDKISIDANNLLTALEDGESGFNIIAEFVGTTVEVFVPVEVQKRVLELHHVELSIDNSTIKMGETAQVTAKAIQFNGEESPEGTFDVFYDTQDAKIATVDENGVVCGTGIGTTDVVVHMKKDSFLHSASISVTVSDSVAPESAFITVSDKLYIGTSAQATATAVLPSGLKVTVPAESAVYSLSACEPEGAVTVTQGGLISATAAGTATIAAAITLGGETLDAQPITVSISEKDASHTVIIDMGSPASFNVTDPRAIDIETYGWEVNPDKTSPDIMAHPDSKFLFNKTGINTYSPTRDEPLNSDLTFDVVIPESGTYSMELVGSHANGGSLAAVYIDGEYIGQHDFYAFNNNTSPFNCIYMDAGVRSITLRAISGGSSSDGWNYFFPSGFVFRRITTDHSFAELSAQLSKSLLSVGETAELAVSAKMADGKDFVFDPSTLWESESYLNIGCESDIISISDSGKITALAAGSTAIKVTALVNGAEKTVDVPITVDEGCLSSVSAELDKALDAGAATSLVITARTDGDRVLSNDDISFTVTSADTTVVSANGTTLTGLRSGSTNITILAELNGATATCTLPVTVGASELGKLEIKTSSKLMKPDSAGIQLSTVGYNAAGLQMILDGASVTYTSLNEDVLAVSATGLVTPVSTGEGVIRATAILDGVEASAEITISVRSGKVASTVYTAEKVANARENIEKYSWARTERDTAVAQANKYLDYVDLLWESVTTQELPRSTTIGYRTDPNRFNCRYCGAYPFDASDYYSGWMINSLNSPWKVQCVSCRRKFPSNDFGGFYKLGVDENGNWRYEQALAANKQIVKEGGKGYLVNDLYPEKGEGWGVDDGYGYRTGKHLANGDEETHTYIAYYNCVGVLGSSGLITSAITSLRDAYMYTGDIKYGRIGAIVLDRVADVYPDMDWAPYYPQFTAADSSKPQGRILGKISEPTLMRNYIEAYDALFDVYDDPYVISYLSNRAQQYNLANDKSSASAIRLNIEDGILREVDKGVKDGRIEGNFGLSHAAESLAAIVLDNEPETGEWIEWLFKPGEIYSSTLRGGNIGPQLVDAVDRDGIGDEGALSYCIGWASALIPTAEYLELYPNEEYSIFDNLKFRKLIYGSYPMTLARTHTPQIGDGGRTASDWNNLSSSVVIPLFKYTGDIFAAQVIYGLLNGEIDDLRYDIFTKDPESLSRDIESIIATHGEYDMNQSRSFNGFGLSILRDGTYGKSVSNAQAANTQRDFWISWNRGYAHRHPDKLNLGIEAFGLNVAPELGYTKLSYGDEYSYWGHSTISHNTVVVNEQNQTMDSVAGTIHHFDDGGDVQVMDVSDSTAYSATDIYRRSLVMVKIDNTTSYGVDFFRVRGGYDHLYSFHSLSDEVEFSGATLIAQPFGSYAGPDVAWATPKSTSGFAWFDNVRRAKQPQTGTFSADFKVTDFRNTLGFGNETDIHLRMTMLNDFDLDEITVATGYPSAYAGNPESLEYVFARRQGNNLDTLFTTVFEPYKGQSNIASMVQVPIVRVGGAEETSADAVKAIKVTLNNNRVDYIVYASNKNVLYRVDDTFNFQGFTGVYTMVGTTVTRVYAHDATVIGDYTGADVTTGTVKDFTRELELENYITVTPDSAVNTQDMVGKYIYIENDGWNNAVYEILGAVQSGQDVILDIGNVTAIRKYKNSSDINSGYLYDFEIGSRYEIKERIVYDTTPQISSVPNASAVVGHKFSQPVSATSPVGKEITYYSNLLPRGASVDPNTGVFSWTPDSYQVGMHHVAIIATDGAMESAIHFDIDVFKSSSGTRSNSVAPLTPGAGAVSGTSGDKTDTSGESGESTGNTGVDAPDTPAERFIDLGNHTWAKEAIYRLVDKGVVNGTSENTYSPAANIKRADFAIMLVRAFGITEGEGENFADVDPDKYYAEELRSARVSGIVNGIGENKFNPEGEITRQDMMLMLARALDAVEYELSEADRSVLADFADAADISEYAADAVSRVVKDGIIAGSNGRINPLENATRAEVAVMLDRVLAE